jgi:uncharacterized cupredoxin-like copper-binding protein
MHITSVTSCAAAAATAVRPAAPSVLKAAAVSSACFILQVEAALIALAVIKQQLKNVALTRGLRLLANNWAKLGGWGVKLLRF